MQGCSHYNVCLGLQCADKWPAGDKFCTMGDVKLLEVECLHPPPLLWSASLVEAVTASVQLGEEVRV
jgi:hypothetical protein